MHLPKLFACPWHARHVQIALIFVKQAFFSFLTFGFSKLTVSDRNSFFNLYNLRIFSYSTVLLAHPSCLKHVYTDHIEVDYPPHSIISFFDIHLSQIALLVLLMLILALHKSHHLLLYSNPTKRTR